MQRSTGPLTNQGNVPEADSAENAGGGSGLQRVRVIGTSALSGRVSDQGPTSWAHLTARLQGEAERSLGDEAAGPLAQILPIPQDPGDDDSPLAQLRADIGAARGKALLVKTTAAGYGEGRTAAPMSDWKPQRLGPAPPESMVAEADAALSRMVAACGASVSLFIDADGTAQREAWRRWHLGTVQPLAKLLAHDEAVVANVHRGWLLRVAGPDDDGHVLVVGQQCRCWWRVNGACGEGDVHRQVGVVCAGGCHALGLADSDDVVRAR